MSLSIEEGQETETHTRRVDGEPARRPPMGLCLGCCANYGVIHCHKVSRIVVTTDCLPYPRASVLSIVKGAFVEL